MYAHVNYIFLLFQLNPQVNNVQRLTGPLPSRVPIITNYAPLLPIGPGSRLSFPFSYPQIGTPPTTFTSSAVSSHNTTHKRQPDSVEAMRESKRVPLQDEDLVFHSAMSQHQQHQQQNQFIQAAQTHTHAQLGTPHHIPGESTLPDTYMYTAVAFYMYKCIQWNLANPSH